MVSKALWPSPSLILQPHLLSPPSSSAPCMLHSSPMYFFPFLKCTRCFLGSWPLHLLFHVRSTLSPLGFLTCRSSFYPQLRCLFSKRPSQLHCFSDLPLHFYFDLTLPHPNSYAKCVLFQTDYLACHLHCGIQRKGWPVSSSQSTSICWVNEWIDEWHTPKPDKVSESSTGPNDF